MSYIITDAQAKELQSIAAVVVGKHVKTGFIPSAEHLDYIQDLLLLMVQHQDDWNVPDGVRFEEFATQVMKRRVFSIWRSRNRKHDPLHHAESLNEEFCIDDSEDVEEYISLVTDAGDFFQESTVLANESRLRLGEKIRRFVNSLPKRERELCMLLMEHDVVKAAKIMNKSRWTIRRMTRDIGLRMRSAGLGRKIDFFSKKHAPFSTLLATERV